MREVNCSIRALSMLLASIDFIFAYSNAVFKLALIDQLLDEYTGLEPGSRGLVGYGVDEKDGQIFGLIHK